MKAIPSALVRTLALLFLTAGLAGTVSAQDRREPIVIEWPNREFPRLQDAVKVLKDGDTLRFAEGTIPVSEPLFFGGKRVLVEGAGCDEWPRGRSDNTKFTHLVGPTVERVVPASDAVAMFNELGGTLRNLKISGFDAGIRGFPLEDGTSPALNITDLCISHTSRGIQWSAPSLLSGENVRIHDVQWTGISVFLPLPPPLPGGPGPAVALDLVTFEGLDVFNAAYACAVFKNTIASVNGSLSNCGTAGILAVKSMLEMESILINTVKFGPGIATSESVTVIHGFLNGIENARGFGLLLHNPFAAQVKRLAVTNIAPRLSDGNYGDGVTVFGAVTSGPVQVEHVHIQNIHRTGLSNFGSFVSLKDTKISCAGIDLEGESYPGPFQFLNLDGNLCGCPQPTGPCVAQSVSYQPPDPMTDPTP